MDEWYGVGRRCSIINMFYLLVAKGGLREGQITEVVGPSSSVIHISTGLGHVCLQAATNVSKKYVGSVVYLDTGNCFSPTRIAQFADQISDPALKEEELSIFLLWALSGYVYYSIIIKITGPVVHREVKCHILEEVMGSILCCSVLDIFAMLDALQQLESNLRSKGENRVRLIIIDSISSLITPILGGRGSHGRALMISAGILLKKLAHEHHLAVLVTNDMVGGEGGNPKPALGESWKSIPHVRLLLSCDRGSNGCNMTIIRHPSMASGKAVRFIIYE